jgi:hypothetical protein
MKKNKFFTLILNGICLISILGIQACGDGFLYEEKTTAYTTQYFETEEGLLSLATALYENIRWNASGEWAYAPTLYGTDEYTSANDLTSTPWNFYDARFSPMTNTSTVANCTAVDAIWNQMYYGIATSNLLISKAGMITNESVRNKCLGEAYFLRGYNYFRLYSQYGAVVLQTAPSSGVIRNFVRSTEEETMQQIIDDLTEAHKLLPTDRWRGIGTWTKYTAAHFLAKAKLFRASERHNVSGVPGEKENWNETYKTQDLADIITLCDEVISACPLADNYIKLFGEWDGIDCANEGLDEILLSAQFNGDPATNGMGCWAYRYFTPHINDISKNWVIRGQWIGGDAYQRCRPTEYNYTSYDNVNDSRLWKSFQTVHGITQIISNEKIDLGSEKTGYGDYGILFILNNKEDTRNLEESYGTFGRPDQSKFVHPETDKWVPCAFSLFKNGKYVLPTYSQQYSNNYMSFNRPDVYCGLSKMHDGTRTGTKLTGHRDMVLARSGETYLIKAEALVRQNKATEAIAVINTLRVRAQWKSDEDREYYTDGAMAFPTNSTKDATTKTAGIDVAAYPNSIWWERSFIQKSTYYLSTGIERTTASSNLQVSDPSSLPAEDREIIAKLPDDGYNGMLHFILNERTRELNGEFNRWEELSRTKLLIPRTKAFNEEAALYIADKHIIRPVPQSFIDGLLNEDGSSLSDEQKASWQNPGY